MLAKQQVTRARGNAEIGVLVVHALWTRITAKKPGVLRNNLWVLWSMALGLGMRISKEATTTKS